MAPRAQNSGTKQQDQQDTGNVGVQRTAGSGEQLRSDRERGMRTDREPQAGVVQTDRSGWGVSGLSQSPFALMRRMMDDMDRMFDDFGLSRSSGRDLGLRRGLSPFSRGLASEPWSGSSFAAGSSLWAPPVEVFERDGKLVVRAEIPGISKDDVNVEITDDVLTIEGERKHEFEDEREGYYRSERSYGRFFRSIPLPEGVNSEKAEANFRDGVLEVTLPAPEREQKRGRRISIR